MIGGQDIKMISFFFFSQFDQQRFNARFRVQKTQAHRAIGCEYGGGGKGRKKKRPKSDQKKSTQKKPLTAQLRESGETVGIGTIYITPFLFSLFVFHLEHLSSLTPNRCSCFLGSFIRISTSNMRWSCYRRGLLFGVFWGIGFLVLNMCNRITN